LKKFGHIPFDPKQRSKCPIHIQLAQQTHGTQLAHCTTFLGPRILTKQVPRRHNGHPPNTGLSQEQNVIDLGCWAEISADAARFTKHLLVAPKNYGNDSHKGGKSIKLHQCMAMLCYVYPPGISGISSSPEQSGDTATMFWMFRMLSFYSISSCSTNV